MSPKSLLRKKEAVSTLDELANGRFQTVIGEVDELNPKDVQKIVMCSGKVYYDWWHIVANWAWSSDYSYRTAISLPRRSRSHFGSYTEVEEVFGVRKNP